MEDHAPLLDDAAVAAIKKKETERKKDRERKKLERKNKREAKAAAKEAAKLKAEGKVPYLGRTAWWESQRAKLTESQRSELAAREQQVFDMIWWAEAWMENRYDVDPSETDYYVSRDDGSDIIMEDKARYGVIGFPVMFTEVIQTDPDFVEQLRRETPLYPGFGMSVNEIFLRYGYYCGLPSKITTNPMFWRFRRDLKCGECKADMGETPLDSSVIVCCGDCMEKRAAKTRADYARTTVFLMEKHLAKQQATTIDVASQMFGSKGPWRHGKEN